MTKRIKDLSDEEYAELFPISLTEALQIPRLSLTEAQQTALEAITRIRERNPGLDKLTLREIHAFAAEYERAVQRRYARRPRRKRGASPETKLRRRGLRIALQDKPGITAETLCEILRVDPLTYDDDDIELRLVGDNIVIRNLRTGAKPGTALIKTSSLREYLSRARNT